MSHPNPERDERVRQIRERLAAHRQEVDKYRGLQWADGDSLRYYKAPDDVDYLLSLLDSQVAGAVTPTTPLLKKIVEIADLGSAKEFGDALERLRAIRGLIVGENV